MLTADARATYVIYDDASRGAPLRPLADRSLAPFSAAQLTVSPKPATLVQPTTLAENFKATT